MTVTPEQSRTDASPLVQNLAAADPDQTAIRLGARELSYAGLWDGARRVAGLLQARGVEPGDCVGLMLGNVPEFAVVYYGILMAGATVVPMNILLKPGEVEHVLRDARVGLLVCWRACAEATRPTAEACGSAFIAVDPADFETLLEAADPIAAPLARDPHDTAVILYTSGTTGRPKGAELTHANIFENSRVTAELFDADRSDVILGALPLFHAFGQTCTLNAAVYAGATLTLVQRFDPAVVLETIGRDQVTIFQGVPTMYSALLHHPDAQRADITSLRICVSGGASIPVELLGAFESTFGCLVLEGYGCSEVASVATFCHRGQERVAGSVGTPISGVEMKVVDDERRTLGVGEIGELAIRGPNVMKGYLNQPEATAAAIDADGWLYTGDIGRRDEAGRYYVVDRKKDLIIRGGYNVYPRELEEVLYEHPAIRETAVVAIAHPTLGEEVGAAVVLKPGATADAAELREFMRERVAAYKYPRVIWFLDELPKGATGKIMKREIARPELSGPA